jgi:hypothetical protein
MIPDLVLAKWTRREGSRVSQEKSKITFMRGSSRIMYSTAGEDSLTIPEFTGAPIIRA